MKSDVTVACQKSCGRWHSNLWVCHNTPWRNTSWKINVSKVGSFVLWPCNLILNYPAPASQPSSVCQPMSCQSGEPFQIKTSNPTSLVPSPRMRNTHSAAWNARCKYKRGFFGVAWMMCGKCKRNFPAQHSYSMTDVLQAQEELPRRSMKDVLQVQEESPRCSKQDLLRAQEEPA